MGEARGPFKARRAEKSPIVLSTEAPGRPTMPACPHQDPPVSDESMLRQELVTQGARLAASDLSQGTSGNLSARCGEGFLITPSGTPYEEVTPEGIVLVDRDGQWPPSQRPSSEWRFHRDIYLARPDA